MKTHTTESCKRIDVFNDVFDYNQCQRLEEFANNSSFRIGWSDTEDMSRSQQFIHSMFSVEDLTACGVIAALRESQVGGHIAGYHPIGAVLNLTTPSDSHVPHTHNNTDKICLVYVNTHWDHKWYGETLFYSESLDSIEVAVPYKPNQVVIFDPRIPHSVRPQSHDSVKYRFTLAIMLTKPKS